MRKGIEGHACRIAVAAIVVLATALRVSQLGDLPAGFYCDEAALGYNAYSLWRTGHDENGVRWPLFVWSFDSAYKNPVYIYAAIAPIALLGLSEFSVRLTSAAFGAGTVVAVFYLGRALFYPGVGLLAALALALCPWHLHFSRVAFELIAFPLLFTIAASYLVGFARGRRTLPAAAFFLGACPYAYAVAKAFVPLFALGFVLLFADKLWRHWRQTLLAGLVLLAVIAPLVQFELTSPERAMQRFQETRFFQPEMPWTQILSRFGSNYLAFFSYDFLFRSGEEILRHSVRGHGELYPAYLPLLLLGAAAVLLRGDRATNLILLWLALYPVGPSLMTEIPSASHGIVGVVPLCVLVGVGAASVLRTITWIVRWRRVALLLQGAALVAGAAVLFFQVQHYLGLYVHEYPRYSAPTYDGFQYGYRDVIQYMEQQRGNYDRLMLTANEVNQPHIFPLFFRPVDPGEYQRTRSCGYDIFDAAEFRAYDLDRPVLFALRRSELRYFSDYTIKKRVVAPGGQLTFVIAEVRARRRFLSDWLTLGLLDNSQDEASRNDEAGPPPVHKGRFDGKFGNVYWRRVNQGFLWVDLNRFYAGSHPDHPGNPEWVCAYAYTNVRSPSEQAALLELSGSHDRIRVWANGRFVAALSLKRRPQRLALDLGKGENAVVVESCETEGDWFFAARVTDADGRDLPGIETHARFLTEPPLPSGAVSETYTSAADEVQVVEGFDEIVRAQEFVPAHPDYRGGSDAWREYYAEENAELAWRSAPCPQRRTTLLAFTATMGEKPGSADLYVGGEYVLTMPTNDSPQTHVVERGGYRWTFVSKELVGGNSGVAYVTVPAAAVTPGKPLELRVVHSEGDPEAWFMVKNYRDTTLFENVTPASVLAAAGGAARQHVGPRP